MSRISPERMEKALQQLKSISKEDHAKIKAIAGLVKSPRSFLFKTPDAYGMRDWHDLSIPSDDGTPLEAWYIPANGGESGKLVIFNHALPMCRAGFPGHFGEPWSSFDAVEIDFVIQYKHLWQPTFRSRTALWNWSTGGSRASGRRHQTRFAVRPRGTGAPRCRSERREGSRGPHRVTSTAGSVATGAGSDGVVPLADGQGEVEAYSTPRLP